MTKLLGMLLVVVGLALAATTVVRLDRDEASERTVATATSGRADAPGPLAAVALPLVAAVCFASGIVLLVVSAGRWSHPRRHPAPGDAVVDPAAHQKMDHV